MNKMKIKIYQGLNSSFIGQEALGYHYPPSQVASLERLFLRNWHICVKCECQFADVIIEVNTEDWQRPILS